MAEKFQNGNFPEPPKDENGNPIAPPHGFHHGPKPPFGERPDSKPADGENTYSENTSNTQE